MGGGGHHPLQWGERVYQGGDVVYMGENIMNEQTDLLVYLCRPSQIGIWFFKFINSRSLDHYATLILAPGEGLGT